METIVVIAAMPQERSALLRLIKDSQRTSLGTFRCDRFQIPGRDCLLVTSGMGLKRATQATQVLVEATNPSLLISVGVAGASNPDLEIGTVVVSGNTCLLDKGKPVQFQPLAILSDPAQQAAEQALQARQTRLVFGTAVTTHGSQYLPKQPTEMKNPVLEMETTGIARVAAEHGIPLLSIRAISDGPRAPIPFNLEAMMDEEDTLRIGEIIKTILGYPRMIPQLFRMALNTKIAAQNAAIALIAALSQPGAVISR
jgi:adenosylhomocysteine nucleosidase